MKAGEDDLRADLQRFCPFDLRFTFALRHNSYRTELPEVIVERKRSPDAQPLHDDTACAIGKAPFFIGKIKEDFGCVEKVGVRDPNDLPSTLANLIDPVFGPPRVPTRAKEREQLVINVVAGNQPFAVGPHE